MIRIYRTPWSTNVERVALAMGHKGLAAEWVDVDPEDRGEVERVSGQPLVPVLDDGRRVVPDSTAILEYLEEIAPDPALYPQDPARRTETRLFIDWFNRVWKLAPNAIAAERERAAPDDGRIAALSAEMAGALDAFECLLDGRDYLFGAVGAADCAAHPFLKYAAGRDPADDELFHLVLDDHQSLSAERHPRLGEWIGRVAGHPRS